MKRKLLSLALAIILIVSMIVPAKAAENETSSVVGYLTLYAANSGNQSELGHAFLEFYNTSGRTLTFGYYSLGDEDGLTISIWRDINNHSGIIYNADSYLHYEKGRYSNRVSLTIPVTSADLTIINNYLRNSANDRYDVATYNCVDFCLNIWYSVCNDYAFTTASPSSPNVLMNSMTQFSDHVVGAMIANNSTVGYFNSGAWVTIPYSAIDGNSSLEVEEPEAEPVSE